jgi:uncharacterized protein YceK
MVTRVGSVNRFIIAIIVMMSLFGCSSSEAVAKPEESKKAQQSVANEQDDVMKNGS